MLKSSFEATYIMPYVHTPGNFQVLKKSISELIPLMDRLQVIIVECGLTPRIKDMNLKTDYIHIQSNIWNVGWMFNCGMKNSRTDKIFFGSFEYIPRMDLIKKILDDSPNGFILLQEGVSDTTMEDINNNKIPSPVPCPEEGITYMDKTTYSKIGGWDENILGDKLYNIQQRRNKMLVPIQSINGHNVIKLLIQVPMESKSEFEKSEKYYERLIKLDNDKLMSYIRSQGKKIGNMEKYSETELIEFDG